MIIEEEKKRNTVGGKRSLYEYKLSEKEEETLKRRSSEDSRSPNEPQTRKKNNSITDKVRMFSQKTDTKKLVTQEVYTESKYIRVYDENTKKYIWVIGKNMQNMDRKGSNENSVENASPSLKLVDKVKMYQTKSKNETNSELRLRKSSSFTPQQTVKFSKEINLANEEKYKTIHIQDFVNLYQRSDSNMINQEDPVDKYNSLKNEINSIDFQCKNKESPKNMFDLLQENYFYSNTTENINETEEILNQKEEISFINKSGDLINCNPNNSIKNEEGLLSDTNKTIRNNYQEESMKQKEVIIESSNESKIKNKEFEGDYGYINVKNEKENSNNKIELDFKSQVHTTDQLLKNSICNDAELNKIEIIDKKSNDIISNKVYIDEKNISTELSKVDLNEFKENRRQNNVENKEQNNCDCIEANDVEKEEVHKEIDKLEYFEDDYILEDLVEKEKRDSYKNKKYNNVINSLPLPKINENLNDDSIYFNIKSNDEVDHTFTYNLTENINMKDEYLLTENNMDFKEIKYIIDNINPQSIKKADKLEKIEEIKELTQTEQSNQIKETIVTSQENEISFHNEECESLSSLNSSFSKQREKKKKDEIAVFSKIIRIFKGLIFSEKILIPVFIYCGYRYFCKLRNKSNTN